MVLAKPISVDTHAGAGASETPKPEARTSDVVIRALGHRYAKSGPEVLSGIDLKIQSGEIVALIGRSGSGKSTLLHIIAGLLKPTDGVVRVGGKLVEKPSPSRVMMFQAPSLYPWMTVAQNAGLGLRFAGRRAGTEEKVRSVLDLVDLTEFAERNVQDLSGGQQQRVAFARSLVVEPDLLLLDEPFSALDIFTRRTLQNDLRAIVQRLGLTMVLVTHDVSEAVQMADRAVLLKSDPGEIAADTPIELSEEDRATQSRDFQKETTRLRTVYSEVAGVS